MSQKNHNSKRYGGELTNWTIHDTTVGQIMTAVVVHDALGRWEKGWAMRSSLVANIDRENGIVETQNTIYKVDENEIKEDWVDLVHSFFF